ncbi:MAG: hypothetical protein WDA68_12200 [Phycisphaerae bacterium]
MEYHIHNKKIISEGGFGKLFEDEVKNKLPKIENKLKNFTKPARLNIYLKKETDGLFQIKTTIKLADKTLVTSTQSDNPVATVNNLIDNLAFQVQKELPKIRKEHLFKRRRDVHQISELFSKVEETKVESIKLFNETIVNLIPTLKSYILNYLIEHGLNKETELTVPEIINEVYLMLYNNLSDHPTDDSKLIGWMFSKTKEWLDNYLQQSSSTSISQIDIQSLAIKELSSLEEKFTMDADGELVMFEDLNDISYFNERMAQHSEKGEYDTLHPQEDMGELNAIVQEILKRIHPKEKLIYEMYWFNDMTEQEITETMDLQLEEVLQILRKVSKQIVSLLS